MAQELSTWQEVATIAGPAIAAIAAVASWASVVQARRLAREENNPMLMLQKVRETYAGTMGAVITNAGGGAARGTSVILTHPPYVVEVPIGEGFLYPGETRWIFTQIHAIEGVETDVMAFCRDREGFAHFWTAEEKHKVFKTRWLRRPQTGHKLLDVFHEFHPDVDPAKLERAEGFVEDPAAKRRPA